MSLIAKRLPEVRHRLSYFPEAVAIFAFVLLFIFFLISAPYFLSPNSIGNILTYGSIYAVITIGVSMLMIAGEFDLSVGSNFAVASYVLALSLIAGQPVWVSILFAILASTALGLLNGIIVVRAKIPSFIATLGTLLAYRGIVRIIGHGTFATYKGPSIPIFDWLNGKFTLLNQLFNAPDSFRTDLIWFVLLAIIFSFILMRTKFGNWIFATGGAPEAASAQGVSVPWVKIICFTLTGFLVALASIMQFAYRLSVDPLRGDGYELIVVAASVIGGVRMTGGHGTIFGAILGAFILGMLEQGLVLMHVPIEVFQATQGLIIIIAAVTSTLISKGE